MENTGLDSTRFLLAKKSSFIFFWVILFATIVRPFFVELPTALTSIGIFNTLAAGIVHLLLRFTKPTPIHIYLTISIGFFCIFPLLLMSGGVNSQFAPLLLVLPIFVCLLARSKLGLVATVLVILLVITMWVFASEIAALDVIEYDQRAITARAFWLCLGAIMSFYFGSQFDSMSVKLTTKLNMQASIDELTQTYNRRFLLEKINELNAPSNYSSNAPDKWISLLMIDVDHFKSINDNYGHDFGDISLQLISKCLQDSIRSDQDRVGRYGGEEFLVILDGANRKQARDVAEKIRDAVTHISASANKEHISFSVTIGLASFKAGQNTDIQDILKRADLALYQGKRQSRNCVVEESELTV